MFAQFPVNIMLPKFAICNFFFRGVQKQYFIIKRKGFSKVGMANKTVCLSFEIRFFFFNKCSIPFIIHV